MRYLTFKKPLTVYYDASCAFCRKEITNLKLYDDNGQMILVDCSADDFDERPFASEDICREDMMNALHVKDAEGTWFIGVEAFEVMYRLVGFHKVAALWGHPFIKPVAIKIYPWIVRNRYFLSKIGMVQLLDWWGKAAARHAGKRAASCKAGDCKIE